MRLNPTFWLIAILASIGSVSSWGSNPRFNVIVIMADDIGYECLGAYGSEVYETPRLDAMAASGLRFNHCYSQPLCTPSRVKLMTGMSNARNYVGFSIFPPDSRSIGHYFQEAGYKTAVVGKWQLYGAEHYNERFRGKGTLPEDAGFDHHALWQVDRLGSRFWAPLLRIDGENRQFGPDEYGPSIVVDHLLEFMETNREEAFFAYYPMILVHNPFEPTPLSESRDEKDKQRNFADMVAMMDRLIGRIVDQVEALGLSERTYILFFGDNGTNKNIRSALGGRVVQGGKGAPTDAGTRVPMIAYGPGVASNEQGSDALVDFSDILPTALDLAGLRKPEGLDGVSFAPVLRGQSRGERETIFVYSNPRPERTEPVLFARDQRWKLYGDGRFYDVANDVMEERPLPEQVPLQGAREARERLRATLERMPKEGQRLLDLN